MSYNLLAGISNIVDFGNNDLRAYSSKYLIRINAVGEQLEYYLKDAICNSFTLQQKEKEETYGKVFAWLGNQNHPPDIIIKSGDAIEIKKMEGAKGTLALNSSPPKDILHSSDTRITIDCKNCDGGKWKEKELFYGVGYALGGKLNHLFFVQGPCYAAKKEVYEKIHAPLKKEISGIIESLDLEKGETMELGKVKRVDPLGITELRVRGMWSIKNPIKVFEPIYKYDAKKEFSVVAIMTSQKYLSFPKEDRERLEKNNKITVQDVEVKDPNNPAKMLGAKLIVSKW